ncbi:uncharacterized protein GIQ15_04410 [Arthroderma uncinatum]|uniref:uncharacterized protein n=1 Tax=Arthroderma uncinatum TaxID=74035 RepID=UPI00144A520C|nr:uncharacterized protein GIQ15_04410 [Arthroderma uncinatum]KAF3481651.1 hypothetical protein GIQ15_04410 [Arthroderma uncinatum]
MGRRAYLNSLALGRSPYEAPELTVNGEAVPQPNQHLANTNADGYVQEYDARGHPINRRSKAEAKQLRKAKNDVLSTMGIVVSGEDLNSASVNEQDKIALLAEENDYGLALAAIDQLAMFGASCANSAVIIVLGQGYMFALLQSLHLLPVFSIPSLYSLIPFTSSSLIQLPPLPSELSARSIGLYGLSLITSPFVIFNLYVNIRPIIEARVYRILRRRLPKPDRPDKLSLRVAVENELIEWTVPSLGKRSEEEIKRSHFTLAEEIGYELITLKNWLLRLIGHQPATEPALDPSEAPWLERYESVQRRVEQLQRDLGLRPASPDYSHDAPAADASPVYGDGRATMHVSIGHPVPLHSHPSQAEGVQEPGQILVDEENRFAQSPLQMPETYFSDMHASIQPPGDEAHASTPDQHNMPLQPPRLETAPEPMPVSRPNTLFSPSPSPESSPPSSPRVRASLIHQNSDVITMHLELLQSHTGADVEDQALNANVSIPNGVVHRTESQTSAIDRAATELLDALLAHPTHRSDTNPGEPNSEEARHAPNDTLQNGVGPNGHTPLRESDTEWQTLGMGENQPNGALDNISSSSSEHMANGTTPRRQPLADRSRQQPSEEWDHRVTILSSHPVDAFSSHLSCIITSVLFYPFESLYLRSLAATFLSAQPTTMLLPIGATATVLGLRSDVRPLGAWLGGGGATDMLFYVGKMALIAGFEAAISAGVWGLGAGAAIILGRMKFQWGQL